MTTKLNVLQVIPKLGYGGAETGCYDIAHFLSENECGSFLATSGGELLKFVKKDKVKLFRLPVHSKNPLLILFNTLMLTLYIIFFKINIIHARSRAPAWSCYFASLITGRTFVTTFHGTYNFKSTLKKFYNSIMLRAQLTIAGSNFIFGHINENYSEYLNKDKKLRVIFRGINIDYFNPKNISVLKQEKLKQEWGLSSNKFTIILPGRLTYWKGQEKLIESLNILIEDYNVSNFQAIILGSDQGRKVYSKKLLNLVDLDGIGETQIQSINSFFKNETNVKIIRNLISKLNIKNHTTPNADGKFSNKKLMFTGGFKNMSRSEAKAIAENNGGKVLGSISKK